MSSQFHRFILAIVPVAVTALSFTSGALAAIDESKCYSPPPMVTTVRTLLNPTTGEIEQVLSNPHAAWEKHTRAGEQALKDGRFGEAEKLLLAALKEAQKAVPLDLRLPASLNNLANLYQARGQNARAEPLYEQAVKELGRQLGQEETEVILGLSRLGQFYVWQQKFSKSEPLYGRLVSIIDRKLRQEQNVLSRLSDLAGFYSSHSGYPGAQELIKRTADITEKSIATQHLELAVSLDALAGLYASRGKYLAAEQLYRRALEIREKRLCPEHMAIKASLSNLAGLFLAQKKFSQAEPFLKRAVAREAARARRPLPTQRTVSDVSSLAGCYESEAKYEQAEELYKLAISDLEKCSLSGSPELAKNLCALAGVYQKQGKYSMAEPLLKRALTITESANGPQHCGLVPVLRSYSEVLRQNHKIADADQMLARAKLIGGR